MSDLFNSSQGRTEVIETGGRKPSVSQVLKAEGAQYLHLFKSSIQNLFYDFIDEKNSKFFKAGGVTPLVPPPTVGP